MAKSFVVRYEGLKSHYLVSALFLAREGEGGVIEK